MLKRTFDIFFSCLLIIIFLIPILVISVLVKLTSAGPILYWSKRVGRDNKIFLMPKFRTMRIDTPEVATHLLTNEKVYLTSIGSFLRKSSLDELPQLFSVLMNDMSFVGPRPALFNQDDLIELRTKRKVHSLLPGITGWAQINGRDTIAIVDKVDLDAQYLQDKSFVLDLKIIVMTVFKVLKKEGITH